MDLLAKAARIAAAVVLTSLPSMVLAEETVEVSPWTAAEFAGKGGDALSIEKITPTGAVVLLNPHSEACTLRFPMRIGEKVHVRGVTIEDQQTVCEVLLRATTEAPSAIFAFDCLNQSPVDDRRCPQ
jgi:hypothetical protein